MIKPNWRPASRMEAPRRLVSQDRAVESERPVSLAQWVADILASRIIEGRYAEGEHLLESQLALELGISRAPVREALLLVARDGLIATSPRRGAVISSFTEKVINDIYVCRKHLAYLGSELAASRLKSEDIGSLREHIAEMEVAAGQGDVHAFLAATRHFHDLVFRRADNEMLLQLLNSLGKRVLRLRAISLSLPGRLTESLELHRALVDVLEKGNAKEAGRAAAEVIDASRRALVAHVRADSRANEP